ncbi:MAG: DNA translocase FtsK [Alistipes sp.]|nr:DNA translocase FtsK [Alistipes sp.]
MGAKGATTPSGGRSSRENMRWIAGLLITVIGVFATLAVLSYYFNWKNDYSILHNTLADVDNPRADKSIDNMCGSAGAWLGDLIVGHGFGVFGLILPILTALFGIRIISHRPRLLHRWALSSLLVMILGSLSLALGEIAFGVETLIFGSGLGGELGRSVAIPFGETVGEAGAALILLVGWILTGVFINSNFINTVNHAGEVVADSSMLVADKIKSLLARKPQKEGESEEESAEEDGDVESEVERKVITRDGEEVDPATLPQEEQSPAPEVVVKRVERKDEGEEEFVEIDLSEPKPEESATPENPEKPAAEGEQPTSEEAKAKVIVVEEHKEKTVSEKSVDKRLYDPTRDVHNYKRPPFDLLEEYPSNSKVTTEEITSNQNRIEETLANFGIPIREMKATIGPTVTLYEIVQEQGVKISKIQGLEDDLAQSLKALGIRIIAPMPGRGTIGIEVPNRDKEIVPMRSSILSKRFQQFKGELPVVIGRTIQNENFVFDLAKMPHLLVAGATGQGKSVGLNAIITSLLYRKHPSELKFVLIDPKQVEFSLYSKIERHFLAKMASEEEAIVTDAKKAVYTLNALCIEMENRLELCKKAHARNIIEYNEKFRNYQLNPENGHRFLPYIVVVVDEFADLIMTAKEVEGPVMRLAQKARAIGIHLIIATQRPDVRVITGGIKANFPARIAFRVMQMVDSRTTIDQPGANQLIGRGDMLFSNNGEITRVQCALVDTPEVEKIVDFIAKQNGYPSAYPLPDYEEAGGDSMGSQGSDLGGGAPMKYDSLFAEIARDAVTGGQISTSYIQRNYEVGFNRAGRIMSQLERAGIVGPQSGAKPREIKFYDLPSLEAKLQDLGVA